MPSSRPGHLPRTLLATLTLAASIAGAQTVRFSPSVAITETLTNNVNLSPGSGAKSDLISTFTPGFSISEQSARTQLSGNVSAPILIYARTGSENDQVLPQVNLTGSVQAIENWFYVDGNASVSQQYLSPFGPRPSNIENINQNRYTAQEYSVSPYVKRPLPGDIQYEIRDTNIWTKSNSVPTTAGTTAYSNNASAIVSRTPLPLGWDVSYNRSEVRFSSQQPFITQSARGDLVYQAGPELQVSLRGGYENADYVLNRYHSSIYGAGANWQPNARTSVNGTWEHRFFGSGYHVGSSYRTPLFAWDASFSRDITSQPQQLAAGAGVLDIRVLLNQLFLSQFPDPIQRQQYIEQFILDHGLPQFIANPDVFFTQQVYLQQQASTSLGLLGARNTIFLSLYHVRTEPIVSTLNPVIQLNNNSQFGGNLAWTHNLGSNLTFVATANAVRTVGNGATGGSSGTSGGNTRQGSINLQLSSSLGPNTSISGGARYFIVRSDLADNVQEAAIFVSVSHTFR